MISTCLGCALIFGAFVGVGRLLPKQESIVIDETAVMTAKDVPLEKENKGPFQVEAKGAVLIDASTGKVLFEQNSHKELPLASVTKVMTMLLVMEAVDSGKITLEDQVTISERAASMGGSQMYMEVGETHTVAQLLEGVAMASANDGCVALAEYVAGSEEIFVERMNKRAEELGMRDSHFVNTNGLPVADHYSSAYDIALMSMKLYEFEETHKWFTTWQSTITVGLPGKEKEFGLTNTNKLIKQYDGCNGIKTGFTSEAGYCLSASATRGDTHLIAVALGCETSKIRNAQVSKMLDYGFANFETAVIAEKGEAVETIIVEKGTPTKVKAVTKEQITALVAKGDKGSVHSEVVIDEKVPLPLKKGQELGKIVLYQDKEILAEYPLVAETAVKKASFKELVSRLFAAAK
ncbi:MAG: D-alanyl-D-alanine carboxypeptidase [Firmicutes bacterium]|nr:D-alanyl-D-alanine carboxypeptidase [Bacillota bacterium]